MPGDGEAASGAAASLADSNDLVRASASALTLALIPPSPPGGAEAGLSHPEAGLSGLEVGAPRNLTTGGEAHHLSGHEAGEGDPPPEREGVGEEVWVVSGAGMTGRPYTLTT